jgi:hypothetical protein
MYASLRHPIRAATMQKAIVVNAACRSSLRRRAIRDICQDTSMPARSTLFLWLRQRPDFRQKYTFAKQFQIQCLADDMIDIADDRANDWIDREGPDGKKVRVFNPENFRRSKQQVAALQWRLSKLKPKRYRW